MTLLSQVEEYFGFRFPFSKGQGFDNTVPPIKVTIYLPKNINIIEFQLVSDKEDSDKESVYNYTPDPNFRYSDWFSYHLSVFIDAEAADNSNNRQVLFFRVNNQKLDLYDGKLQDNSVIGFAKLKFLKDAHYEQQSMCFTKIRGAEAVPSVGHAVIDTERSITIDQKIKTVGKKFSFYPDKDHQTYILPDHYEGRINDAMDELIKVSNNKLRVIKGIGQVPDRSYEWRSLDIKVIDEAVEPTAWAAIPRVYPGYYDDKVANCSELTAKLLYKAGLGRYDRTQLFYIRHAFLACALIVASRDALKNSVSISDFAYTLLNGFVASCLIGATMGGRFENRALAVFNTSLLAGWKIYFNNMDNFDLLGASCACYTLSNSISNNFKNKPLTLALSIFQSVILARYFNDTKISNFMFTLLSGIAIGGAVGGAINGGFEAREWSRSIVPFLSQVPFLPRCIQSPMVELVGLIGAFFGAIASIIPISDHTCNNLVIFPAQLDLLLCQCKAVEARLAGIKDNNTPKSDSPKMDLAKNIARTTVYLAGGFFAMNAMRNVKLFNLGAAFEQGVASVCEGLSIPTLPKLF